MMKMKKILALLLSLCLLAGLLTLPAAAASLPGDLNGDGEVNNLDALALFRAAAGQSTAEAADLNGDGAVNAADAAHLFAYVSGEPVELAEPEQHFTFEGNLTGRTIAQALGGDVIAALRLVTYTADGEEYMIPFVDADGTPHSYGALEALQRWQEPGNRSVFGYPGAHAELTLRHEAEGYTLSIVVNYEYLGEIASVAPDGSAAILPADAGLELTLSPALVSQSGVSAGDKVTYTRTNGTVTSVKRAATYTAKYEGYSTEPFLGYTYTFLTLDGNTMAAAFGARRALAEGLTVGETYTFYLDSLGDILDAEPAQSGGEYDTQTTSRTVEVNRGLGVYEISLTGGTGEAGEPLPDYLGDFNASLRLRGQDYELNLIANFNRIFYLWNEETMSESRVGAANYKTLRVVLRPFEGERFDSAPLVTATYYCNGNRDELKPLAVTAALQDGKAVMTAALPDEEDIRFQITCSYNGLSQTVNVNAHKAATDENESVICRTWTEALAELAEGNSVRYIGSEDVTLTGPLTLSRQSLEFEDAALTIGRNGLLTMEGDSYLELFAEEKGLTITDGGELCVGSSEEEGDAVLENYGNDLRVAGGGKLTVLESSFLNCWTGESSMIFEEGSLLTVEEGGYVYMDAADGGIRLGGTSNLLGSFDGYGSMTVEPTGKLSCNGSDFSFSGVSFVNRGHCSFSHAWGSVENPFENYGELKIENNSSLNLENRGYTVYNRGSIIVGSGSTLTVGGTVLENSGSVGGEGDLYLENQATPFYENGIVRVERDRTRPHGPDNYSRRCFAGDPARTVEVVTFYAELTGSGSCSVNVVLPA